LLVIIFIVIHLCLSFYCGYLLVIIFFIIRYTLLVMFVYCSLCDASYFVIVMY